MFSLLENCQVYDFGNPKNEFMDFFFFNFEGTSKFLEELLKGPCGSLWFRRIQFEKLCSRGKPYQCFLCSSVFPDKVWRNQNKKKLISFLFAQKNVKFIHSIPPLSWLIPPSPSFPSQKEWQNKSVVTVKSLSLSNLSLPCYRCRLARSHFRIWLAKKHRKQRWINCGSNKRRWIKWYLATDPSFMIFNAP